MRTLLLILAGLSLSGCALFSDDPQPELALVSALEFEISGTTSEGEVARQIAFEIDSSVYADDVIILHNLPANLFEVGMPTTAETDLYLSVISRPIGEGQVAYNIRVTRLDADDRHAVVSEPVLMAAYGEPVSAEMVSDLGTRIALNLNPTAYNNR